MVQNNITPSINNTGMKPPPPHLPDLDRTYLWNMKQAWMWWQWPDSGRKSLHGGTFSVIVYLDSGPLQTAPSVDRLRVQASRYCAISILFISESENTSKGSSSGYILPGEHKRCQKNCTSRLNWHLCWYFSPRKARHCSASLQISWHWP